MEGASIRKLPDAVVDRIAAGEVIESPVSVVKELVENSLDAGASKIHVTVVEGGKKLIMVQDNGHGVKMADLPELCVRHTTSKLSCFEDLQSLTTMGFRGEALASISFVSHLEVTTMGDRQSIGVRALYRGGQIVSPCLQPCAAVPGTTICVADLFFNMPLRKKALASASDEYSRILELLSSFAVHRNSVGFICRQQESARPDLQTLPVVARPETIRAVYGASVAHSLIHFGGKTGNSYDITALLETKRLICTVEGYLSTGVVHSRKPVFLLFVNSRLVDLRALHLALDATYAAATCSTLRPFWMVDLILPENHVDINVHASKRQVGLHNQEAVIQFICQTVEQVLPKLSRESVVQAVVPVSVNLAEPNISEPVRPIAKRIAALSSGLPEEGMLKILSSSTFVGMLDDSMVLVQHQTGLFLLNLQHLSKVMFLQTIHQGSGSFASLQLQRSVPLRDLLHPLIAMCGVESQRKEVARQLEVDICIHKRMLAKHFGMIIDFSGCLCAVPQLLAGYKPDAMHLPYFLLKLAMALNCHYEAAGLESISKVFAEFYSVPALQGPASAVSTSARSTFYELGLAEAAQVLISALKKHLTDLDPPFNNSSLTKLASVYELYKVFERC